LLPPQLSLGSLPAAGESEQMHLSGTGLQAGYAATRYNGPGANGAALAFAASRGATYGTHGAVVQGDGLGVISAFGDDGTNFRTQGTSILAQCDGTVAAGIVPGRLLFYTANSAGTLIEAMRIDSAQAITHTNGVTIGASGAPTIRSGTGAATGTQPSGSIWIRTDGSASNRIYVNQGGTTWVAIGSV
jgi:hypothetical protein